MAAVYPRFVTPLIHERSRRAQGLFQTAYRLRDEGAFEEYEREWFEELNAWFCRELHAPKKCEFSQSWPSYDHERAIFWFVDLAHEHIRQMRQLVVLLRHHGVVTRELRSDDPGRVVYEDDHQVAAIPFLGGVS